MRSSCVIEQAAKAIRPQTRRARWRAGELQKALGALDGLLRSERGKPSRPPARPATAAGTARIDRALAGDRQRRADAGPSRADQFLALVAEHPGITVAETAERLNATAIHQTLYNVTARLQREGRLRKNGRGFHPAEQPPAPAPQEARGRRASFSERGRRAF